eukprot:6472088-Amphidinium_carterae.3
MEEVSQMEAWRTWASTGTDPKEFIDAQSTLCYLLLPETETKLVLERPVGSKWTEVADELRFCYSSCDLGHALFGTAMASVCEEAITACVQRAMQSWESSLNVTQAEFTTALNNAKKEVDAIAGVSALKGRRKVKYSYRGVDVEMTVDNVQRQVEYGLRLRLRAEASRAGLIKSLPAEDALVADVAGAQIWSIGKPLLTSMIKARQMLWEYILETDEDKRSGDTVEYLTKGRCRRRAVEEFGTVKEKRSYGIEIAGMRNTRKIRRHGVFGCDSVQALNLK